MQDVNHIPDFDLIAKFLAGEADDNETQLIEEWISDGNQSEFERIKQIWQGAGSTEYSFDTEKALENVNKRINQSKRAKRIRLYTISAAAIILLIAIPTIILKLNTGTINNELVSHSTSDNTELVALADGSNITLNKNSSISYPENFKENRTVKLEGEAFFEVEHIDKQHKFIVETNGVNITVIGTKFNVLSDKSNAYVEVSVSEGIVEVKAFEDMEAISLTKGQSIKLDLKSSEYKIDSIGVENDIYWITEKIIFKNSDLNEISSTLSKIYEKEFILSISNPEQYRLTTEFDKQTLDEILNILELTLDISIESKGEIIYLTDAED